jgi:hypothetical protein
VSALKGQPWPEAAADWGFTAVETHHENSIDILPSMSEHTTV